MLVSEIATRVRRQFGDDAGVQIADADVIRWVNDAMREIALANGLLQIKATTPSVAGTSHYGIPTDILSLHTLRYDGLKLKEYSLQEADDLLAADAQPASGIPQWFYREVNDFVLYPTPDASSKSIVSVYTRLPVEVTITSNTPELPLEYHNRIVEYCIAQAAELDDNLQLSSLKMQQFENKVMATKNKDDEFGDFYPTISALGRDAGYDEAWY